MNLSFNFVRGIWTNGLIPKLIEQYGSENLKINAYQREEKLVGV